MRKDWTPKLIAGVPSGLILFDGVCVFCSKWVAFVIAWDRARVFRFLTIQSEGGQDLATRLGIDPAEPETNAMVLDGVAYMKSDAALMVLTRLPGWGWVKAAWLCPKPMRDFLYDRIARNRYRIFGRRESCIVPDAAMLDRFIERLPVA